MRSWLLVALTVVLGVFGVSGLASAANPEQFEELLQIPRDRSKTDGAGAGRLSDPRGIGTDPVSGHVFIAEKGNARISEFTSWGAFVKAWGWGVADGSAEAQTCGPAEPEVAPAATLCQKGIAGNGPGQFTLPRGVAVDATGNVYVVDGPVEGEKGTRVQKFSPSGQFLLMFGAGVNKTSGADTCTKTDIEAGDVPIRWSTDERSLLVFRKSESVPKIYAVDLTTGSNELWKEIIPADPAGIIDVWGVHIAPDDKSYYYSYMRNLSDLYVIEGLR